MQCQRGRKQKGRSASQQFGPSEGGYFFQANILNEGPKSSLQSRLLTTPRGSIGNIAFVGVQRAVL
jgi:hypothetical protein